MKIISLLVLVIAGLFSNSSSFKLNADQPVHLELVDVLMKYGMSPGFPAINQAMEAGDYEAVKLLVERGVDINTRGPNIPMHIIFPKGTHMSGLRGHNNRQTVFEIAVENEDKKLIKYFLDHGVDPYSSRYVECVVLEKMADPGSTHELSTNKSVKLTMYNITSIHDVIENERLDILLFLIKHGFDINKPCTFYPGSSYSNSYTKTPLELAVSLKKREVVKILLDSGAKI